MSLPVVSARLAPPRGAKAKKWHRVDRELDLRLEDPAIDRDARSLANLRDAYRKCILKPAYKATLKQLPTLYWRYRGARFPLTQRNGKKVPVWRMLSPWMKIQIATLVLADRGYLQFKIHLHDDLRAELEAKGENQKDYLRDRLGRCLRSEFGAVPWFFFVMEDLTDDGQPTRPHAHGSIELRRLELPRYGEPQHLHFRRIAEKHGVELAELAYGRAITRKTMLAASGNGGSRPVVAAGLDQKRNVWLKKPNRPLFNHQWVTYAFKNMSEFSPRLGERRLALPHSLCTETTKLWNLIRHGEEAVSQWI